VKREKDEHPVPNTNGILSYVHCKQCFVEDGGGGRGSQQLEVGWTMLGIQVWCARHEMNVVHIDFEGHQHPGNTTAARRNGPVQIEG
jgi:hypothetical protein